MENYVNLCPDILRLGEELEAISLGAPKNWQTTDLVDILKCGAGSASKIVSPELLIALHEALSSRLRDALAEAYNISQDDGVARLAPRMREPQGAIIGLHGACDKGLRFAGLFYELLCGRPISLVCPDSAGENWSQGDMDNVARLVEAESLRGVPVWIVGLSAGANMALLLRQRLAGLIRGVIAISSSPARARCAPSNVPTFYIHGSADTIFPLGELKSYLSLNPEPAARLITLEGWGHAFPYRILERYAWPWLEALVQRKASKNITVPAS